MPRTTTTVTFDALQVVGGLLPSSLLEQAAEGRASEQDDYDYGLERGERLRDRIDAAWVQLKEIWKEYVDFKERAGKSTAGLHFALRLLREVFAWPDLQPIAGYRQSEWVYPITHRAFGGSVPLILRGLTASELDQGMTDFGQDHRRRSPHDCLQECLNADDQAVWGLLCCGEVLRLLHDNLSLVKPAYLAVDLELLVEGEKFDEFAVLWVTLHASRFWHPGDGHCVLDLWKQEAEQTGERVLWQLRAGVESALLELGRGFLSHPANHSLRGQLQERTLSCQLFHEELLRLIYQFLFLFTAEDRDLLFPGEIGRLDPRRQIYSDGYSVGRLRKVSLQRSAYEGHYGDLWEVQKLMFSQLSREGSPLGLPGLGGLFLSGHRQHLQECELENRFLLRAIHQISWFRSSETGSLTRVNYRDLNTEELGSVYEVLLELHPEVKLVSGGLELSYVAGVGRDRKVSGSYYTPNVLVQQLIKSTLVPVIHDRLAKADRGLEVEALLDIKVIDPASGSGHFLLAATRMLALELARARAGKGRPSELDRQRALREVVSSCIYAVDKNPMAVELCKVALWIEAVNPGKPLGFLDAHILCGDSVVGVFDAKVLEQGIPDGAYKPLPGDNKAVCTSLKKENTTYRKLSRKGGGLQGALDLGAVDSQQPRQQGLQTIEATPEESLPEIAAKKEACTHWQEAIAVTSERLAADLYCASFFLPMTSQGRSLVPTTEHLLKLQAGQSIPEGMEVTIEEAASTSHFFHWYLSFEEVMQRGGFDCVLGNPPWISLSGRQAIKNPTLLPYLIYAFPSTSRWPSLHSCFLIRAVEILRESGRIGLVLPSQMIEQSSYVSVLLAASSLGGELVDLVDIGEGAFPGVTQSCSLLSVNKLLAPAPEWTRPRFSEPGAPASQGNYFHPALEALELIDKFSKATFSDLGVHTGNISKKVILPLDAIEQMGASQLAALKPRPVREGRQISPYCLAPPTKGVFTGYLPGPDEYWTCRDEGRYTNKPILVRQTARRPIAALHDNPCYFRNSILACKGVAGISHKALICILNSSLIGLLHRLSIAESGQKAFPQVKIKHLSDLPLPPEDILLSEVGSEALDQLDRVHDTAAFEARTSTGLSAQTLLLVEELVLTIYGLDPGVAGEIVSALDLMND